MLDCNNGPATLEVVRENGRIKFVGHFEMLGGPANATLHILIDDAKTLLSDTGCISVHDEKGEYFGMLSIEPQSTFIIFSRYGGWTAEVETDAFEKEVKRALAVELCSSRLD